MGASGGASGSAPPPPSAAAPSASSASSWADALRSCGATARLLLEFLGLHKQAGPAGAGAPRGLQIIGAGFPRSGTKSLEAALVRLGHRIYDVRSMAQDGNGWEWLQAAKEAQASRNYTLLDGLLGGMEARGYTATLDVPMHLLSLLLAARRPTAKVIMTVRDSTEAWVASWHAVLETLGMLQLRPWRWLINADFVQNFHNELWDTDFQVPSHPAHVWRPLPWFDVLLEQPSFRDGGQAWKEFHDRLRLELEEQLPKERLLVLNVRSGWRPLLTFLDVDDPALVDQPFPWVNHGWAIRLAARVLNVVAFGLPFWVALLLWACLAVVRRFGRCARHPHAKQS